MGRRAIAFRGAGGPVLLIGDRPEVAHGENTARSMLAAALERLGLRCALRWKLAPRSWFGAPALVWLFPGHSRRANRIEFVLILYWRLVRRRLVLVYFHNRSVRYFARAALWMRRIDGIVWVGLSSAHEALWPGLERLDNYVPDESLPDGVPRSAPLKRLVWLSRIDADKGFAAAYELFRALRERDPEWRFDVIGPPGDLPLAGFDEATFLGPLYGRDKFRALGRGGIFVLPSRNDTQPLVVIEALSQGLPALLSTHDGIGEMIRCGDRSAGAVYDPADARAGADAIEQLYASYHDRAADAHRIFQARYTQSRFDARLAELLAQSLPGVLPGSERS